MSDKKPAKPKRETPEWEKTVKRLLAKGDREMKKGEYETARTTYEEAWEAIKKPRFDYSISVKVLRSIAETHFAEREWNACLDVLMQLMRDSMVRFDDSRVRIRLGQCMLEIGNEREAGNWMAPIYLFNGKKPFENEDPKYLAFLRKVLKEPEGGWPDDF